ncbi:hypothetical protein LJC56_08025 [Christensenellaceae bacterium OttesenSCG-928-K19]|nr:hypothetical protein [Christensenellaceae bacterium OttesenSCG-928-K19]
MYNKNPDNHVGDIAAITVESKETGEGGLAIFEGLLPNAKYYVRETSVPNDIVIKTDTIVVDTNNTGEVKITVENERKGQIAINKVAQFKDITSGEFLEETLDNIEFEVRKAVKENDGTFTVDDSSTAKKLVTKDGGYVLSTYLDPGWYEVKELATSPGLGGNFEIRGDGKYYVEVKSGQINTDLSGETPIINTAIKGRFRVEKFATDAEGEKQMLAGAMFMLHREKENEPGVYEPYKVPGGTTTTFTVGEGGIYMSGYLTKGNYMIKETKAPEGYTLDEVTEHYFTIEKAEVVTIDVENYAKASLLLTKKTDALNGSLPLNGATFQLYRKGSDELVGDPKVTGTDGVVAGDGTVLWEGLDAGDYYVKETKAPAGYEQYLQTMEVTVQQWGFHHTYKITATNTSNAGRVLIKKIDMDSGKTLAGARFAVYENVNGAPSGTPVGNITFDTDGTGFALSPLLPTDAGGREYWIVEVKAPDGYMLDDTVAPTKKKITVYPIQAPVSPEEGQEAKNYVVFENKKADTLEGFSETVTKTVKKTGEAIDTTSPYLIDKDKFDHGLMQGDIKLTYGLNGYATGTNPLPYETFSVQDTLIGMQYQSGGQYIEETIKNGDYTIDAVRIFAAKDKEGNAINATVQYQTGTNTWKSLGDEHMAKNLQNLSVSSGALGYITVDLSGLGATGIKVNYLSSNNGTGLGTGTKFVAYGVEFDVTFKQREGGPTVHEIQRISNTGSINYSYKIKGADGTTDEVKEIPVPSNEVEAYLPLQDIAKPVVELTTTIDKPTDDYIFYPKDDLSLTTVVENKSPDIPLISPVVSIDLPAWTTLKNPASADAVIVTMYDGTNYWRLTEGTDFTVKMDEYVQATELDVGGNAKPIYDANGDPVMVRRMTYTFPDYVLKAGNQLVFMYEATISTRMPRDITKLTGNAYVSSAHRLPESVENPLGMSFDKAIGMGDLKENTGIDNTVDALYDQSSKGDDKPGENKYLDAHDTIVVGVSQDLQIVKEVKGPYDTDFKEPGDPAYTLPSGDFEYRITFTNNSTSDVYRLRFIDILPFKGDSYVVRSSSAPYEANARKTEVPTRPTLVGVSPSATDGSGGSAATSTVYYYEDASGQRWTRGVRNGMSPDTDLPMLKQQGATMWTDNGWVTSAGNIDDVTAVGIDVDFPSGLAASGGTYTIIMTMKAPGFTAEEVTEYYDKMMANSVSVSVVQDQTNTATYPTVLENDEVISYMRLPTGTIGDYVFWDKDNDGMQMQDPDEPKTSLDPAKEEPLSGVKVHLYEKKYAVNQPMVETARETTTNADGYYEFTDLPCNMLLNPEYEGSSNPAHYVGGVYYTYELYFEQPTVGGQLFGRTFQNMGDDTRDSDIDENYRITDIRLKVAADENGVLTGETNKTLDAGFTLPMRLGDYVWLDANKNGIQDEDEVGVNGVTVNLYRVLTDDDGKQYVENYPIATMETERRTDIYGKEMDGLYLFNDLPAGTYVVEFDISQLMKTDGYSYQYAFTEAKKGALGSTDDSDAIKNEKDPVHVDDRIRRTDYIVLDGQPDRDDMTWDAGLTVYSAIGGYCFDDQNYNHVQDLGIALPGTVVTLYKYDDVDNTKMTQVGQQTVGNDGTYYFDFLEGGEYVIHFDFPDDYIAVDYREGDDRTLDSDVGYDMSDDRNEGWTERIILKDDEVQLHWDAGAYKFSALGDYVWFDADKNGIQDAGEKPVEGVKVTLQRREGPDGLWEYHKETVTDANGYYWFDGLKGGLNANYQYRVIFLPDDKHEVTIAYAGSNGALDSNALPSYIDGWGYPTDTIILGYGQEDPTWDCGIIDVTAAIGDQIWFDSELILGDDNMWRPDGVQNRELEPGVEGALVLLEYTEDNPSESPAWKEIGVAVTNSGGYYRFNDLKRGNYRITFYLPQNYDVTVLESDEAKVAVGNEAAFKYDSDAIPNDEKVVFTDEHTVVAGDAQMAAALTEAFGVQIQAMDAGSAMSAMAAGDTPIIDYTGGVGKVDYSGITVDPAVWDSVKHPNGYKHVTRLVYLQDEKTDWSWDAGIYKPPTPKEIPDYREGETTIRTYGGGGRGSVRTGDDTMLWLWVVLAAIAGVAIIVVLQRRKKAYGRRR